MRFADLYERDSNGLILFPTDTKEARLDYFVPEVMLHPAKMNIFLAQELIDFTSGPGEVVMDIMAGTGTILLAAMQGRRVIAIELSSTYAQYIQASAMKMRLRPESYVLLQGDCRGFLPIPGVSSIIFSPPYAQMLKPGGGMVTRGEAGKQMSFDALDTYNPESDPNNLGLLNPFLYNRAMDEIYKKCFQSLKPGGLISIVVKDIIRDGKRVELGLAALRLLTKIGFTPYVWERWKPQGSVFVAMRRKRGETVVEDEHIIIGRKP